MNDVVEEKRAETNKMAELLLTCSGTHSFTRQLKALLIRVDKFLESVGVSMMEREEESRSLLNFVDTQSSNEF